MLASRAMALDILSTGSDSPARASSLSVCDSEVLSADHDSDRSLLSSISKTSSSSSSSSTAPSLYAATKLLALVNGFRKRVKAHSQLESGTAIASESERQAFEQIDRYLGKEPRGIRARARDRVLDEDPVRKRIDELLFELESPVKSHKLSLKEVASNNTKFLDRSADFTIDLTPLKYLRHLQVVVKDLLETLRRIAPPHTSASAFPAGKGTADPTLDFTYIANLEHLLLCLQQQLNCLLIELLDLCGELLRKHIAECQKDHDRYCKEWFFEYPDVRHPLSTTWPWNIKPSLVILWGVCWMFLAFYHWDSNMNLVETASNRIVFPGDQAAQLFQWRLQQQNNLVNSDFGFRQDPAAPATLAASMARMPQPPSGTQPRSHSRHLRASHQTRQATGPPQNLGVANTNITYTAQPTPTSQPEWWRPENQGLTLGQHQPAQTDLYNAYGGTQQADTAVWPSSHGTAGVWSPHQQGAQPAQNATGLENSGFRSSPLNQRGQVPTIAVITDFPNSPYSLQQQGSHPSSSTSYHASSPFLQPQEQYLTPQRAHRHSIGMEPPMEQQDATASQFRELEAFGGTLNGNHVQQPINAQRSPSRSPGPELSRKRSFTQMQQQDMQQQDMPVALPYGQPHAQHLEQQHEQLEQPAYEQERELSQSADDGTRAKTIKRPTPPMTADHKYYCNHSDECVGQTFDRKCEWSKHMDKHDRPYTCPQPQCAKLQGFTYSGGLLRHEREVHGKHGGPREQLRCHIAGCKRTTGKGFTRKENLNEHLRRVHSVTSPDAAAQLRQTASDALPGAEAGDPTAGGRYSDGASIDDQLTAESPAYPIISTKRRRQDITSPTSVTSDVESELARLRQENQDKDERIQRVEQEYASTQERLRNMEEMLARLTSGQLATQVLESAKQE
nr:hypothetical protein B0A51_09282 [Rachicladosporium sp. CCFEE 5018]